MLRSVVFRLNTCLITPICYYDNVLPYTRTISYKIQVKNVENRGNLTSTVNKSYKTKQLNNILNGNPPKVLFHLIDFKEKHISKKNIKHKKNKRKKCLRRYFNFFCILLLIILFYIFRWEEEKKDNGVKWNYLEHKGPVFAPAYEPLPGNVKFYYDGREMKLSEETEEVASFYARMLDHDYTTKDVFNKNFFHDWRQGLIRNNIF